MAAEKMGAPPTQESKTIRVAGPVYDKLTLLSENQKTSIGEVVAELVDERARKDFFQELQAGYAALRSDETAWRKFQEELAEWDVTLNDGLDGL